jgi:hypothetical protein
MRLTAITLFVHILGVIAIFGGFSMQQRAGGRLRRATRYDDARTWAEMLMMSRSMVPAGAVMVLVTGAYLATRLGPRPPTWVIVAALTALFIGTVALAVVNRGITAIGKSVSAGEGPLSAETSRHIASAATWSGLASANGAALGTLWLMTAKPGSLEAVLVVVLLALAGAIAGARLGKR